MDSSIKKTRRILKIFYTIIGRLPSTYPKPQIIIHNNLKELYKSYFGRKKIYNEELPYAFCNGKKNSVHVISSLNNEPKYTIAWFLLHELGHLRAIQKYGEYDPRWYEDKLSETYADKFANMWCRRLEKENLI